MPGLGGLRRPRADSANTGWRNDSFRGFADYMQTPEFESVLADLGELVDRGPFVIMCAEAVPWRCHRSLIADALLVRNIEVEHILSPTSHTRHKVTPMPRSRVLKSHTLKGNKRHCLSSNSFIKRSNGCASPTQKRQWPH